MADILTLKKFEIFEPVRDQERTDRSGQDDLQDHAVRVPQCRPRQSQLDRDHAARRLLPARPVCHHREQARDGAVARDRRDAAGQRHRRPARRVARQAHGHARRGLPVLDGEVRDQDLRVRPGRLRPRARRFDHRRQLSGAGSHAGPQRADRARISDVGDVRQAAAIRQVRPLRGRRRHRRDVLHLQIAEGQSAAVSRRHDCARHADLHALSRDDAPGGLRPQGRATSRRRRRTASSTPMPKSRSWRIRRSRRSSSSIPAIRPAWR